jgi:hypothetical protein
VSTLAVNSVTDANGGNTATINTYTPTESNMMGKNRIINGDMRIDQRNAGASVTLTTGAAVYPVDRFFGYKDTSGATVTGQQSSTAPTGFINSFLVTVSTGSNASAADQNFIQHSIEGTNISDLGWGTANAKTISLSFWVRSSLTGTYGIGVSNNAADRCYVATYTINSANTWEYKTIYIPGDTSGTWLTTNGLGIRLRFDFGTGSDRQITPDTWGSTFGNTVSGRANLIGTTGATFYITGVQLEVGSVATPFERRPYGTELALCQRYYYKIVSSGASDRMGVGYNTSTTQALIYVQFAVSCRTSPTALEQSGTAADYTVSHTNTSTASSSVPVFNTANINGSSVVLTVASGLTAGQGSMVRAANTSAYLAWSAEL